MCCNPIELAERLKSKLEIEDSISQSIAYSQPNDLRQGQYIPDSEPLREKYSFSQPSHNLIPSPINNRVASMTGTQFAKRGLFVDLFPSAQITRFFSHSHPEEILEKIQETFEGFLVPSRIVNSLKLSFTTVDKRKCQLTGEVNLHQVSEVYLVSFRKRRGDPLEFKRLYKAVLENLKDIMII